jgi:protein involved in polysaccharide export with SLBB domain
MKNYVVLGVAGIVIVTLFGAQPRGSVHAAPDDLVFVVGSVVSPGQYRFEAKMTAGDAIDEAGGLKHPELSSCIFVMRQIEGQKSRRGATRESGLLSGDTVDVLEVNDGGRTQPCPGVR